MLESGWDPFLLLFHLAKESNQDVKIIPKEDKSIYEDLNSIKSSLIYFLNLP